MTQIGTIEVKTESGIKEVPVFDTADVDYDFVRVQTENGTGALNLVPKADAELEELRVNTSSQGVLAVSTSISGGDLTATATIPTDTTAKVTVYEDTSGDGAADNVETVTLQDGENGYPLENISGGSGNEYWLSVELTNTDIEKTAEIDSVELAV
jgi:hypothetical protein